MASVLPYYQNYLIEHAARLVWCSPYEDEQYIIEGAQLTDSNGDIVDTILFQRILNLPTPRDRYHVYMLGGNYPEVFNLSLEKETWLPLPKWCREADFLIRIYNEKGILTPLCNAYYFLEEDGNMLIAIRDDDTLDIDYGNEPIYFHFRSTQYWKNDDTTPRENRIFIESKQHLKGESITDLHGEYIKRMHDKSRHPMVFLQGRPSNGVKKTPINHYIELEDDGSVLTTEYFRLSELRMFHSELDKCDKYLIALKELEDTLAIHYRDDIEIFPVYYPRLNLLEDQKRYPDNTFNQLLDQATYTMGCYYHRNKEDSLRMVTNNSYSLPVDYVLSLIRTMTDKLDPDNWYLKVVVRKSGLDRKLIAERHHVMELNQLSYEDKLNAMTDTESTVDVWKARELEKSDYNFLMRCWRHEITPERVLSAYGYDQSSLAMANPNVSITKDPNGNYFIIPVGLMDSCTVYEYDKNGLLLGWYYSEETMKYRPVHEETIFIEAISGKGSEEISYFPDVGVGNNRNITVEGITNYRIYKIGKALDGAGITTFVGSYQDVTKTVKDFVQREDGFSFTNPSPNTERYDVYGDNKFLCRNLILTPATDGVIDFTLVYGGLNQPLNIVPAKLSIWLNGHALIENIDYRVKFPVVTIFSRKYVKDLPEGENLNITYRAVGFSRNGSAFEPPRETGYVVDGKLSVDYHYDLHQNKINRIVIGGGVYNPHLFNFDVQYGEAKVNLPDGTPYMIDDHYIALRGLAGYRRVYSYQEEDRGVSDTIRSYLVKHIARKELPPHVVVNGKYELNSPFMSAIITHVFANEQAYLDFDYHNKAKITRLANKFKHLLDIDPAVQGYDEDFAVIDPQPYTQTEQKVIHHRLFGLFDHINKTYLNGKVRLNHWFKVTRTRKL